MPWRTERFRISSFCDMTCLVGSTGLLGGDAGHGGVSTITFIDHNGVGIKLYFTDEYEHRHVLNVSSVAIQIEGDDEANVLVRLLRFAASKLSAMIHGTPCDESQWTRWFGEVADGAAEMDIVTRATIQDMVDMYESQHGCKPTRLHLTSGAEQGMCRIGDYNKHEFRPTEIMGLQCVYDAAVSKVD